MRGVSPVCVYRAWTPSLADRRMPFRFFYVYWLGVGHKRNPYSNGKDTAKTVPKRVSGFSWLVSFLLSV